MKPYKRKNCDDEDEMEAHEDSDIPITEKKTKQKKILT